MNKKSGAIIKLISIVISVNLFMVNTCYGITVNTNTSQYIESQLHLLDVYLPESVGCVEKVWQTDSNSRYKVILIKDAHCNYEAQRNIARIVETLIRDYKLDLVCIEGASEKVDTSVFQSFPYGDIREKAVDKYMGKGLLSGTEALSISKALDLPFTIWGVEDSKLYVEDFKAFRNTMVYGSETGSFITNLKKIINLLKPHIFSQELLQFDSKLNEYIENRLSLSDWAKYLDTEIKDKVEYPINSHCEDGKSPDEALDSVASLTISTGLLRNDRKRQNLDFFNGLNFGLVIKSIELEEKIDFKLVENERALLIKELEKTLVKEDLENLVKQSLYFKLGKISGLKYYSYLEALIPRESNSYPNLLKYIDLVKLQSKIDSEGLFSELEMITNKVAEGYFCSGLDRQLYELSCDCRILDKIFHLNMSRSELDYYHKNRDKFQADKLLSFISIQAPLYNIPLPAEFKDAGFLKKVSEFIVPAEEFYQLALKRDEALVGNLLGKMEIDNKQTAIIVTGGFHSQGIEGRLQDKGISYITISPKITKIQENNPYLKLMMDSDLDISSIFSKNPSNISLPPLSVQPERCRELGRYLFDLKVRNIPISKIRKMVPGELLGAFNELVRLAGIEDTQSVDDLLNAISPDNIIGEIAKKDFPNETLAEADVERLKLALLVAGVSDISPYLEKLRDLNKSSIMAGVIGRMFPQRGGGFIGKYEILQEPVFDKTSSEVSVKVRDIETGQERDLGLDARLENAKKIKAILKRLIGTMKDSLAKGIIEESLKSLPDEFLIIEGDSMKNEQAGILGIGRVKVGEKYAPAIAEFLLDDPVALFHEIGEMYFSIHDIGEISPEFGNLSGKHLFAHTFLRGCGEKVRGYLKQWQEQGNGLNDIESYNRFKEFCKKEYGYNISEREEALILFNISKEQRKGEQALWGLQDKAFGSELNFGLTKKIKLKKIGGGIDLENARYYQMPKGVEVNNESILDLLRNLSRAQQHSEPHPDEITCVVYRTKESTHASTSSGYINEFTRRSEHIGTPVVIPNVYIADENNPERFVKLNPGQIAERFGLEVVMDGSKPLTVRVRSHEDHGRMFYVDQDMTVVLTKDGDIKGKYFGILSENEIPNFQAGDKILYGTALEFKGVGTSRCRGTYREYRLGSKVKGIKDMLMRSKLKKAINSIIEETITTAQNEGKIPKIEWLTFFIDQYFKQRFSIRYKGRTYEEFKASHIDRKPEYMVSEAIKDYLNELMNLDNYEVIQWLTPDWIEDAGAGMFLGFRYQEIVPDAPGTVKYHSEERARLIEKKFLKNGGIPTVVSIAEVPLDARETIGEDDKANYGSSDHGFSLRVRIGGIRRMNNADQTLNLGGGLNEKVFMDVRYTLDSLLHNVGRNVRAYLLTGVKFSNDELKVGKDIDVVTGGQCDHGEMEVIVSKLQELQMLFKDTDTQKKKEEWETALIEKFFGVLTQIYINVSKIYTQLDWKRGFSDGEINAEIMAIYVKFLLSLFDGNIESVNNIMQKLSDAERKRYPPERMNRVLAYEIYRYWQEAWPDNAEGKLSLSEDLLSQRLDGLGKVLVITPSGRIIYISEEEYEVRRDKGAVKIDRFKYDTLLDKRIGDLVDEVDNAGYQDKGRLINIRFGQAMVYIRSGDISNARYIYWQIKNSGQTGVNLEELNRAIEDYQRFLYALEAVAAGSIEGARENLSRISSQSLRERIEGLIQKLPQELPHGSKASWELRDLLKPKPEASGVFESSGFPNLVFKIVSAHERHKYEEEMERMWRIAQKYGYKLVVVDGYILIKIEGIVPFAYMDGIIVQQKTKSLQEQYPGVGLQRRRKIVDKIAKRLREGLGDIIPSRFYYSMVKKTVQGSFESQYEQLHFSGVTRVPDLYEGDIGFIEGRPVYTGIGKTSTDEGLTHHSLVKLLDAEAIPQELPDTSAKSKGGFIGKYEIIEEAVFDKASGMIRTKVRNIETGEEKEVSLKGNVQRTTGLREQLEKLAQGTDNELAKEIINNFLNSLPESFLVLEDNEYAIFGVGKVRIDNDYSFAIAGFLLDDPVGIFHEIGEMYLSGYDFTSFFIESLPSVTKGFLTEWEKSNGKLNPQNFKKFHDEFSEYLIGKGLDIDKHLESSSIFNILFAYVKYNTFTQSEKRMFVHTFLRGCGEKTRYYLKEWVKELKELNKYTFSDFTRYCRERHNYDISPIELLLIDANIHSYGLIGEQALWGLQDKAFGKRNKELTKKIKGKTRMIKPGKEPEQLKPDDYAGEEVGGNKYIYDPIMRGTLIEKMKREYGFIGRDDTEFRSLYSEVDGIFRDVLKAACEMLIAMGREEQAEGLMDAELFLADVESANAFACIYFNFIAVNIGLFKELQKNGLLSKDVIAFILAHEVVHLLQYREDVEAGRVDMDMHSIEDFLKKKFHEHQETYAREYDADTRAIELVNRAGYSVGEVTTFFEMLKTKGLESKFEKILSNHPPVEERIVNLQRIRESSNWREVHKKKDFSKDTVSEIEGERSEYRKKQERLVHINTFNEFDTAVQQAQSLEELEILISWVLTRMLKDISSQIVNEVLPEDLRDKIRLELSKVLEKYKRRKGSSYLKIGNKSLWIEIDKYIDDPEIIDYFLLSYLATGDLPNTDICVEKEKLSEQLLNKIRDVFSTNEKVQNIIAQRDSCREACRQRAESLLAGKGGALPVTMMEMLEMNFDKNYDMREECERRIEKLLENKGFEELINLLKKISPSYDWGFDLKDAPDGFSDYLRYLRKSKKELFNICINQILKRLAIVSKDRQLNELLGLLDLLSYKQRELLEEFPTSNMGKILGIIIDKIGKEGWDINVDREIVLRYFLKNKFLHNSEIAGGYIYEELFREPESEEIISAIRSSRRLRGTVYKRFREAIRGKYKILFSDRLRNGDIGYIIELFDLGEGEVYSIYDDTQLHLLGGLGIKERLTLISKFISSFDNVRKKSSHKPLVEGKLSKGLWEIFGLVEKPEDRDFLIEEVKKILVEAKIDCDVSGLDVKVLRLIYFFNQGGIMDVVKFRKLAMEMMDDVPIEELEILALFLNSEYMSAKQIERGMPSVFSIDKVDKGEAARRYIISAFRVSGPDEVIVNGAFYQVQTWAEYILFFNLLVYLKKTGQTDELEKMRDIDNNPGLYRMFQGEVVTGNVESKEEERYSVLEDKEDYKMLQKLRIRLTKALEGILKRLIFSTPKYLDRRNLIDEGKDLAMFKYILDSSRPFTELLTEIKTFLPKSVYRNYLLLCLLAKVIREVEPSFDLTKGVSLSEVKKIIQRRQRQGKDNTMIFNAIEEIAPLLLYDARMDNINQSVLAYLGLKRSGKRKTGIGQGDMVEIYPERELSILNFADYLFRNNIGAKQGFIYILFRLYRLLKRIADYLYSNFISAPIKHILNIFREFYQLYLFYKKYKKLKNWYLDLKEGKVSNGEEYVKEVKEYLDKRYNSENEDDIDFIHLQVENYFRETILKKLYEDKRAMRVIRWLLVYYNRLFHKVEKADIFHFDFQGRETQLDTGIPELLELSLKEKIKAPDISFDDKKAYIERMFRRKSALRDKYLEMLAEYEIENQGSKEVLLKNLNSIRGLFFNNYFKDRYSLVCLELEMSINKGRYDLDKEGITPEEHYRIFNDIVNLVLRYFETGYLRDDILLTLLEKARTYNEYMLIKDRLYQYKGDVIKDETATKTVYYEDRMKIFLQDINAKDKKDLLLWILGIKEKPLFLVEYEEWFGVSFDRLREVFAKRGEGLFGRAGESVRREFVRQMFIGKDGILSNEKIFYEFMDEVFNSVVPKGEIPKETIRIIMRAILKKSDERRRLEIVQALSINLAGVFEGEKKEESEVIARFFESLGLIGIKMAQVLAHSMDIPLSQELRDALTGLSSRADPLSKMVVFETIQNLYPGGFSENFEYIGDCLGSASIKIVYRAKRKGRDGEHVIKIKRPKVAQQLKEDLEFLKGVLDELKSNGLPIPQGLGDRVSGAISDDTDFNGEYEITQRFNEQVAEINRESGYRLTNGIVVEFAVAGIHEGSIINNATMECDLASGVSLDKVGKLVEKGIVKESELQELKRIIFDFLMTQMFRYGFYNADPHGGNFHIAREDGKLKVILIDCGSAEEIERTRENFMSLLEAMIWLSISPGKSIPEEYLYTLVFFKKTDYLRKGLSDIEIVRIMFDKMGSLKPTLTPEKYLEDLKKRFSSQMTSGEKVRYIGRTLKRKLTRGKDAYFGEGSQETINPQIKKILEDETGKDFYCMFRTTDEGRKGNLKEAEQYRVMIESALRNLGIEGYDVVVLRGVNFSGHYGRSRQRIYIPIEILEIASQNPDIEEDLIEDFIKHEYLESTGLSHEETMKKCNAKLNRRAQILYRKYVVERILEGIEGAEKLKRRVTRILKGHEGIKDPKELLLTLERGRRFELTPNIARLVDLLDAGERGKKVLLIANEIVRLMPAEAVEEVTKKYGLKEYEVEEKLLRTMKKMAQEKGIDPNCIQSVFDLFRQGMDLLTLYPELSEGEVDGAYFDLVDLLGQITGLQPGTIMNVFTKRFGIKARVTQGEEVLNSPLDKEVRRLRLYLGLQEQKDYRFTEGDKKLFDLDFNGATIIQNPNNNKSEAVQYLSELDAVSKDVENLCQGLDKGARVVMENSQPTMLYYHASSFIDLDKVRVEELGEGRQRITFSHEPGLNAVLRQLAKVDRGKGLVRIALGISKDKKEILEKIIESAGLKGKVFVVDEVTSAEGMEGVIQGFKDVNRNNFVFINNGKISEKEANKSAENGIKVFGLESGSSFHASLLFAVMYARAPRDKVADVISSLSLFGVSREEIDRILEQLKRGLLYFTVKLFRIKDTLENFRNHRLYTDVAA